MKVCIRIKSNPSTANVRKELEGLVVDNMAPPNTRSQGKPPGKAPQRKTTRSKATDDTKSPNAAPNTPRPIFRDALSGDSSSTSLSALASQLVDSGLDEWHGFGYGDIVLSDDDSSSSSGITHSSTESIHASTSSAGDKAYVKKRRRLSVRQGAGESSTNVLSDLASSQDIDSGSIQTSNCHQQNS